MRRRALQRRAITRVETIVIAVTILLILTIGTAGLARLREEARAKTCLTILSRYATAFAAYTADHNNVLPYENVGDEALGRIVWYDALTPYMDRTERICPSVDRSEENSRESYRMNSKLAKGSASTPMPFRRLDTLDRPAATVIIFDAEYGGRKLSLKGKLNDVDFRHNGKANLLFADWRVEPFERNRLMQDSAWLPPKVVWDPDAGSMPTPQPVKPRTSRHRYRRP
jgi:prepilin-type processing-associated H-X9-DG protein